MTEKERQWLITLLIGSIIVLLVIALRLKGRNVVNDGVNLEFIAKVLSKHRIINHAKESPEPLKKEKAAQAEKKKVTDRHSVNLKESTSQAGE